MFTPKDFYQCKKVSARIGLFIFESYRLLDQGIQVRMRVDEKCPLFTFHFPSFPIVPGACILQLVADLISSENHDADTLITKKFTNVTFVNPVVPGAVMDIRIDPCMGEFPIAESTRTFRIYVNGSVCCRGIVEIERGYT